MEKSIYNGLALYHSMLLGQQPHLLHFVSGRSGGYSKGPFSSLNTGFHVGDNDWHVLQNRKKMALALNLDLLQLTYANQTHSSNIAIMGVEEKGLGSTRMEDAIANSDALITAVEGICLCIQTADCVPLLLYDPVKHVAAAIHAGWRGTLRQITSHTITTLVQAFGCNPTDLLAFMGPSNGPCCYEVGGEVKKEAAEALGCVREIILPGKKPEKYIFDQWQANKLQLLASGLPEANIEIPRYCSQCQHELFFSSRVGGGTTGRTTSGIMLKARKTSFYH